MRVLVVALTVLCAGLAVLFVAVVLDLRQANRELGACRIREGAADVERARAIVRGMESDLAAARAAASTPAR